MLETNDVLVAQDGHVMIITLNRPEARNAVTASVSAIIGEALEEADQDSSIRCVIITGAGEHAFCAGADLKALARGERPVPAGERSAWGFAGIVSHPISKPLIAAVNGYAVGGGTEITLSCDIAIASEKATFGLPEVRRGILAAAGGAFRLATQLPPKIAMELLLTGDLIDAPRALELGLVNAVVPHDTVLDRAITMARRIAENAPLAVQATKRIARGYIDGTAPLDEPAWALSDREMAAIRQTEDAREGPRAFAEKRPPVWSAR